jgi:hypothetical protein
MSDSDISQRPAAFSVELVTDAAIFAGLAQEWDELLLRSEARTPFLAWEWLYPWWQHLRGPDRELYLILVRDAAGRLTAIAPFCRRFSRLGLGLGGLSPAQRARLAAGPIKGWSRAVEFLGMGEVGSDYLDLIIDPAQREAAFESIVATLLARQSDWDALELSDMPEDGPTLPQLERCFIAAGAHHVANLVGECCPYIALGARWEDYVAGVGASLRRSLQRTSRLLAEQHGVAFVRHTKPAEVGPALNELVRLHRLRRNEMGGTATFEGAREGFHQHVCMLFAERGWLSINALRRAGRPLAGLYAFELGDTFYYYQSGFDPAWAEHSIGTVLLGHCIRAAIDGGRRRFDFLRGDEPYKWRWTGLARATRRLQVRYKGTPDAVAKFWGGRLVGRASSLPTGTAQ